MMYISELFPNPAGSDTGNEWIEVCNDGTQAQSLAGWKLQDANAKSFVVGDVSLTPRSCVVFDNVQTKISLNNNKEIVSLLDAGGNMVDSVSYNKAVKDNQVLARAGVGGELQITTTPTKGEIENRIISPANTVKKEANITDISASRMEYGIGSVGYGVRDESLNTNHASHVLVSGTGVWETILIGACVAGVLATIFVKIAIRLKLETKNEK